MNSDNLKNCVEGLGPRLRQDEELLRSAKMYAQAQSNLGDAVQRECRPSPTEEAEKEMYHHRDEAARASEAVQFLIDNPAFSKFIDLIRRGVIRI